MHKVYEGSVKDIYGPAAVDESTESLVFRYTDHYSIFDWGRMPEGLDHKGEALAIMCGYFMESLESAPKWQEFSKSQIALDLRKGVADVPVDRSDEKLEQSDPVSLSTRFNEEGELLQKNGLRTHYLGMIETSEDEMAHAKSLNIVKLSDLTSPTRNVAVERVAVVPPQYNMAFGRPVLDYEPARAAKPPKLIPLEVVFRFGCPPGSSLIGKVKKDPSYLGNVVIQKQLIDKGITGGEKWSFPMVELFTKLEKSDRRVLPSEALAISGLTAHQLQEVYLKTIWTAGFVKWAFEKCGLEVADGKFEFALDQKGEVMIVDGIGPDELRVLKGDVQISKEFLRNHYRGTSWYDDVKRAKDEADSKGILDWKSLVKEQPPELPVWDRELGSQVYMATANALTGRVWFDKGWSVDRLVEELKKVRARG